MEYGDLRDIFANPYNPYTLGMQNAFPTLRGDQSDLISIPGSPPDIADLPDGCRFLARCPFATEECGQEHPPLQEVAEDHYSACYHHDRIDTMRTEAERRSTWNRVQDDGTAVGVEGADD